MIKSIEDNDFSLEKMGNLFNTLDKSQEYFENIDSTDVFISSIENKQLFEKINQVYKLLNVDIYYSYLAYQYMKFFGQNSKNYQDILSIVMSSIYHDDIKFNLNFPFDDDYFNQVESFVSTFQNEKENQLNYKYLSKTNNIILNIIKNKENQTESIKINNLNIDEETNLINEEYKSITQEDIKETNVEGENENSKKESNNNNESINNAKLNSNNPKKNKKRKISNQIKNFLRLVKEKQKKEKSAINDKDNKHDNIETSKILENEIIQVEKSNEDNIINNNDEFSIENENKIDNMESPSLENLKYNLKPKEKLGDYLERMYNYYNIEKKK